jgi:prepilin-type N-terminal cleavage/methylation domain-containing protein
MKGLGHHFFVRAVHPPSARTTVVRGPWSVVSHSPRRAGFTLIEIMIVVGIMGIVMMMSIPMVYKLWHKAPMIKAVRDVSEVLSRARAQAIMQNSMAEVVFHPHEGTMEVSGAVSHARPSPSEFEDLGAVTPSPPPEPHSGMSATIDPSISIEMLDVNLTEYKDADIARARFYPNGTCDELTLILHSDRGEWYKIALEITTSLATVGPVDR